ncbi:MAG TPA: ISL3 family transposase [Candidatus Limnocylindrales bacterium]|jgi:transposase|nr:ISL3 family transposase [Candidatus Limnocylindrales bacterium]
MTNPPLEDLRGSLNIPLDIPNVEVEKLEIDQDGNYRITVHSTERGTHCHKCGGFITDFYGYSPSITLRHLPILGRQVEICIRPQRYQCQECAGKPTTTQKLGWYEHRSPHTQAFEQHILLACVNSTVLDVGIKEGISYEAVRGIIDRYIAKGVDWELIKKLKVIGIDEIALKKGHQDFATIITGRIDGKTVILGVLADRKKETVKQFLMSIPKRLRREVRFVCCDMYIGFVNAAREVFGKKVRIVVDRFHVAKLYGKGLDELRKKELERLRKTLPKEQYKELEGVMWILRKRPSDLMSEEQEKLNKLFEHSPLLKKAYALKSELTALLDSDLDRRRGKQKLTGWMNRVKKSSVRCFDTFLNTLETYKDEIANYFMDRLNSGFVEGLNNKIKVIKRRCYGLKNVGHLFQHLYLDLCGYALYAPVKS